MACATPGVAYVATAMAHKRATVRVNVSDIDTAKIMKKCTDEVPLPLPVMS